MCQRVKPVCKYVHCNRKQIGCNVGVCVSLHTMPEHCDALQLPAVHSGIRSSLQCTVMIAMYPCSSQVQ